MGRKRPQTLYPGLGRLADMVPGEKPHTVVRKPQQKSTPSGQRPWGSRQGWTRDSSSPFVRWFQSGRSSRHYRTTKHQLKSQSFSWGWEVSDRCRSKDESNSAGDQRLRRKQSVSKCVFMQKSGLDRIFIVKKQNKDRDWGKVWYLRPLLLLQTQPQRFPSSYSKGSRSKHLRTGGKKLEDKRNVKWRKRRHAEHSH